VISSSNEGTLGHGVNGLYSYATSVFDSFTSANNQTVTFNGLKLSFTADDHIQAIFVNGVDIGYGPEASKYTGWTQNHISIALSNVNWNVNGNNIVEFIVHNVNYDPVDDYFATRINPTGLSATIQAIYDVNYDPPGGGEVPEPATLLLWTLGGLGLAGAKARQRRMKKLALS